MAETTETQVSKKQQQRHRQNSNNNDTGNKAEHEMTINSNKKEITANSVSHPSNGWHGGSAELMPIMYW